LNYNFAILQVRRIHSLISASYDTGVIIAQEYTKILLSWKV